MSPLPTFAALRRLLGGKPTIDLDTKHADEQLAELRGRLKRTHQAGARILEERNAARAATAHAEDERRAAHNDLRAIGEVLARRHLIAPAVTTAEVRPAVDAALGALPSTPPDTVVTRIATAITAWAAQRGRPQLFDAECHDLACVAAAAVADHLANPSAPKETRS